jgi:RNA-directed DNA polymerase
METYMLKVVNEHDLEAYFSFAYSWLKKSRKHYPPSSDIWDIRRCWHERKGSITHLFVAGSYRFDVQKKISLSTGETMALWPSPDALILKVLTILIQEWLKPVLSKACYHLRGHGGLKRAVNEVLTYYPKYRFFCKTDVKGYYDSIDHYTLLMELHNYIKDNKVVFYIWQFLNRTIEWGGLYQEVKRGISWGSSLSPLLGGFYLPSL